MFTKGSFRVDQKIPAAEALGLTILPDEFWLRAAKASRKAPVSPIMTRVEHSSKRLRKHS
jgi:hypothetical protein